MADSSRVSVALCTCDGAEFLREQLASIAVQSRPVDEVVVADDASTDGTVGVVESFKRSLPIRLHANDRRLGVTKNFERAVSLCTGDVIMLCDQDDVWHPDKVRKLLEPLASPGVGLVFSNAAVVNQDLSPAGYRLWDSIWFDGDERRRLCDGQSVDVLARHAVAAGSTAAFRADFLPLVLPFPDLPHAHDVWIALMIAAVARVSVVDLDLIRYRLHENNSVGMRKYGLLGQIKMARRQIETRAFAHLADLHAAAADRLTGQTRWQVRPGVIRLLRAKSDHSKIRRDLPASLFSRLGPVAAEWHRGNYGKFSYGYKSLLQDLFLR